MRQALNRLFDSARRLFLLCCGLVLLALNTSAHSPFGSSTLVTIGAEVKVELTMGRDGSVNMLTVAGQSKETIAAAHPTTLTNSVYEMPAEFSSRLFVLKSGETNLAAKSVTLISDGVDDAYILVYSRPEPGLLEIAATYFQSADVLAQGVLIVQDAAGEQMAAALLSKENSSVKIPLDAPDTNLVAAVDAMKLVASTSPVEPPAVTPPARPSFGEFLKLGVWHILTGFDHLLFLCALLICVRRVRPMLGVTTCFTLAHSVTLALAALEWVTISSRIIEPSIAASIIVVGIENLVRREEQGDRYWMAGCFGLIHGFGFASALRETGLGHTGSEIALPLFSFNLGVEAGQLAVAAVVVPLLFLGRRSSGFVRWGTPTISMLVIALSAYWLLQRLFFT